MEVRLLVDDLKLTPKDVEKPKPVQSALADSTGTMNSPAQSVPLDSAVPPVKTDEPAGPGGVSVSVDHLAKPGTVVSGKVTFSDGNRADWYLDQTGRLGLAAQQPGYRPPPADLQQFQLALEAELSKMGL
jgi:hypothetical protein